MNARVLLVWIAAVLALSAACASTVRDWRDLGERTLPFEDVWSALLETCGRHGFVPNTVETDRGRGEFTSRWRSWTQGFGQSRRLRVRAELKSAEQADQRRGWQLRFCVERQKVADMSRSLDPREQDWSADGQDRDIEDVIEAQLRMRFGDANVRPLRSSTRS